MSQVPEEPYTQLTFRNTFKQRFEFVNVTILGADSSGTHFYYDDARGVRHFGVITDLLGPRTTRNSSYGSASASLTTDADELTFQTVVSLSFTPERQPCHILATMYGKMVGGLGVSDNQCDWSFLLNAVEQETAFTNGLGQFGLATNYQRRTNLTAQTYRIDANGYLGSTGLGQATDVFARISLIALYENV